MLFLLGIVFSVLSVPWHGSKALRKERFWTRLSWGTPGVLSGSRWCSICLYRFHGPPSFPPSRYWARTCKGMTSDNHIRHVDTTCIP